MSFWYWIIIGGLVLLGLGGLCWACRHSADGFMVVSCILLGVAFFVLMYATITPVEAQAEYKRYSRMYEVSTQVDKDTLYLIYSYKDLADYNDWLEKACRQKHQWGELSRWRDYKFEELHPIK